MIDSMRKTVGRRIPRSLTKMLFFGRAHYCPICRSWIHKFRPFGVIPRANAMCPICGSLERHRLVWLFFQRKTNLFDRLPKRMLHVAPETVFKSKFRQIPALDYVTADLFDSRVMVKMDITAIPCSRESFDVIYCSHVLEHVAHDRQAMREFNRVLKPDGWAVLQVPITAKVTFKDPSVISPEERERLFGQRDHVRRYGPDYRDRLEDAGFCVESVSATEIVSTKSISRVGVSSGEEIFFCGKG